MSAGKVGHHIASINLFLMPDGHVEMRISPSPETANEADRIGTPVMHLVSAAMRSSADHIISNLDTIEIAGGTVQ